jgi:type IV secretory pathway VirB2 component (pilin)
MKMTLKKKLMIPAVAAIATAATALPVMAETTSAMSTVQSSLTSSFTEIGNSMTSTITSVLPIALPIIGIGLVVSFGLKWFKKITSKA